MRHRPTITAPPIVAHAKFAPCITYVRAKNISPLRARLISFCPTVKHRHTPNRGTRPIRPRTTVVRAKNISPPRAPLIRLRPHVSIARPPHAAAPRMYGRKIFRPYVRHQSTITQPSNIAAPQIVAHAKFAPCITYVRAKYFSPLREPLMRNRPTINHQTSPHPKSPHPPPAAAPWMYGRKIFRPYVCD